MGCEPDRWAKDWLEKERSAGRTGLTVEKRGNVHYLRWATTVWNKETRKRNKISEQLGILNPDGTVTEPRGRRPIIDLSDVRDSGNAKVLAAGAGPFLEPLKESFARDYPEMIELAFARCLGKGELKRAGKCWKNLDDVLGLRPNTDPSSLSETLERVGRSRGCQDMFFDRISSADGAAAVDLSVMFSKSKGAFMSKKGYNRFNSTSTQFNILLACGLGNGRPQYMKALAGNIGENSVGDMLDEFDIPEGTILVMDRAYCSEDIMKAVTGRKLDFLVAAKRNSLAYEEVSVGKGMFAWKGGTIFHGTKRYGGMYAYRFENLTGRSGELAEAIETSEKTGNPVKNAEKAGNLILFSSREMAPANAYRLYKLRCTVENCFDTAKNVLSADRTYMSSDEKIAGHAFITFLSLCIWTELSVAIEKAGLSSKFTVTDILDTFASVKSVVGRSEAGQTIGKDVRELDSRLGFFLYSEKKEERTGKKRGRPPKASKL